MTDTPKSKKEQYDEFLKQWSEMIPEPIVLSRKDWDALIAAIENPPAPTPALIALMRGEDYIAPDIQPHKYEAEETSGIGFCKICHCDNMDNPIHIKD